MNSFRRFSRAWLVVAVASGALVASAAGRAVAEEQTSAWHAPGAPKSHGRKKKKKPGPHARATAHRAERRHHASGRGKGGVPATAPRTLALVTPSPGPLTTPAAARAMDQVRRNQIERAESAARRPELTSRWQTVEFLLSGVDEERYPEAGFWRALACYRRGDIEGGDGARRRSQLAAREVTALDNERTVASLVAGHGGGSAAAAPARSPTPGGGLQAASFVQATGMGPADRIRNDAPYTGTSPTVTTGLATN
jgi:hypothetical protein